jgi:hypothetical protein
MRAMEPNGDFPLFGGTGKKFVSAVRKSKMAAK